MQGKLSRAEMKKIQGGTNPTNDGCKGIIECPTLDEGDSCLNVGDGTCHCHKETDGTKVCI
ncbi:MAG: hypothetical protein KDC56_05665 [Flavobacteriaceae bacterium]|nr:hypothetical protein [Flavobacteriaceae bacterium]